MRGFMEADKSLFYELEASIYKDQSTGGVEEAYDLTGCPLERTLGPSPEANEQALLREILRGLGDTHTPMIWNLAGHWLIGLPLGYSLGFAAGLGIRGLWWGLSLGLIICGTALLIVWHRRVAALAEGHVAC